MSKMQKYTLMGLMLLILCLVTWALATGLGILQGNAAAAAAQETAEGVSYLKKLEKQDVTEVETILQEREREHQQEQIQTGQVDESSVWDQLKDVVIMGDSRAVGFYYFKFLDHSQVLATGGATIADIEGQMGTLKALNPPQLFLCYGLNDISIGYWKTKEEYITALDQVIQKLHKELPNTTVYISSILPARDPAFERSKLWRQIPDFNVAIKAFCAEKEYPYVDNTEICEQYADLWQYDGIHVRQEFYAHWGANMIRAMRQYG